MRGEATRCQLGKLGVGERSARSEGELYVYILLIVRTCTPMLHPFIHTRKGNHGIYVQKSGGLGPETLWTGVWADLCILEGVMK